MFADPFDSDGPCINDAFDLQSLGINAIYVQGIHIGGDPSTCMDSFKEHGIYVLMDLGTWTTEDSPQILAIDSLYDYYYWDNDIYTTYKTMVDIFSSYSNLLGFVIGQSTDEYPVGSYILGLPFLKAAVRDIKGYITSRGYRKFPVGYFAANNVNDTDLLASYLNCANTSESVDFWALSVDWCGKDNQNLISTYETYGIPTFFGGYNCSTSTNFSEMGQLYSTSMSAVFSGGFRETWSGNYNPMFVVDRDRTAAYNFTHRFMECYYRQCG